MKKISRSTKILISILLILCVIATVLVVKDINEQNSKLNEDLSSNASSTLETENDNDISNPNENTQANVETNTENTTQTTTTNPTENDDEDVSNELFAKYYEQAEQIMKDMTLEEKVGQMFLVRYPDNGVINQIKNEAPGGYILFGKDFDNETKESILKELTENQQASKIGLIFGVDE